MSVPAEKFEKWENVAVFNGNGEFTNFSHYFNEQSLYKQFSKFLFVKP